MKIQDYAQFSPEFILEDYFQGDVKAQGIFIDRFGNLKRQFDVDIKGSWDPEAQKLTLVEDFVYNDGATEQRIWHITKKNDHSYIGKAEGVAGEAKGDRYGNTLNWAYDFDLKVGESTYRVHFDDWMHLQADGKTMINRAEVTKWGFKLGDVILSFEKQ